MSNQLDAIIDSLLDGESPQLYAAASVIESQAREISRLTVSQCTSPYADSEPCRGIQIQLDKIKELRAALVEAVDAMEDFDYDKRMAAIAKCREVL